MKAQYNKMYRVQLKLRLEGNLQLWMPRLEKKNLSFHFKKL